ncbi:MAG: aminoglycoside phosphotransferase family protein [bacterium]|nr:aminoglycoside phosphotransferase family protein [bacterium]
MDQFEIAGERMGCERYGSGHINDTFLLVYREGNEEKKYVLQRVNGEVFKDIDGLMGNISRVTRHLRKKIIAANGDPDRETLSFLLTKEGRSYYLENAQNAWRVSRFVTNASCYDVVKKPEDFYQSARAFGHFQRMLADYPAEELVETIPDFHNTPVRFETFKRAVLADVCHRAAECEAEIRFVMEREAEMGVIMELLQNKKMPYRVTHNDTKLNNVMIDDLSGEALCVIDLDTIMPGASVFDYGDSIRFGANTAEEDETDLTRVSLSLPLFEIYTKGFLEGCEGSLTPKEIEMLPMGAKLMTLECGLRFLTDYLQGDTYFKIQREKHNLDRCRTQFALVADMEAKWQQMQEIVQKYS